MPKICKYNVDGQGEPFIQKINGFSRILSAGADGPDRYFFIALTYPELPEKSWRFLVIERSAIGYDSDWSFAISFADGLRIFDILISSVEE